MQASRVCCVDSGSAKRVTLGTQYRRVTKLRTNNIFQMLFFSQIAASMSWAQAPPDSPSTTAASPPVLSAEQVAPVELAGLLGQMVLGPENHEIGRIVNVLADAQGRLRAVVLDVGGFMGVGNRKVAVAWTVLRFTSSDKGPVVSISIQPDRIKSWAEYIAGRPVAILGASGSVP